MYYFFKKNSVISYTLEYILISFYLTIFLEGFILYKNDIVIARLLWEIYTCMNIPMRKFKILSNFVYSCILQYMTMKFHLLRH